MRKVKILLSSVGSLVGQNILDVLEHQSFYRRNLVELIGTNSIAENGNMYRCDRAYLVSNTNSPEFVNEMLQILSCEEPDLILCGRDEDTVSLAIILSELKDIACQMPYGEVKSVTIALNKWTSYQFCQKYDLPFAESFAIGESGDIDALEAFIMRIGYPLIAKPVEGFASKGVFFVRDFNEATHIAQMPNYMFQEYLGDPLRLKKYFSDMDTIVPLFAHAPNIFHHSCHTVIHPNGSIDPVFTSLNQHDSGVTMGFRKVDNEELEAITVRYANAVYGEGGYGPVTVQFRQDINGNWKAQEFNRRTNGNTFPRFLMGQDDIGLIVEALFPEFDFPVNRYSEFAQDSIIDKQLTCNMLSKSDIKAMKADKKWKRLPTPPIILKQFN